MVENTENSLIVPMLDHVLEMNQRFLDPRKAILVLGKQGAQLLHINPLDVANGQYSFELRAASRMVARQNMQQSLPFIMQNFFNPAFQSELAQKGIKLDVQAVTRDMMEVLGWRSRSDWFVPMSQEDMQRMQQQQMGQAIQLLQMKNQHDDQRMAVKGQQKLGDGALQLAMAVIKQGLKDAPGAASSALLKSLDAAQAHLSHDGIVDEGKGGPLQ
jgi:hypothetical protein